MNIGYDLPSAGGPRGYARIDWTGICNEVIRRYVENDLGKYDIRRDAVLAKASGA